MKAKGFKWWLVLGIEVEPDPTHRHWEIVKSFYKELKKETPGRTLEYAYECAQDYFAKYIDI